MSDHEISQIVLSLNSELTLDLVYCPPGSFIMGQGHDPFTRQHNVSIDKGFWIGTKPITRHQFSMVVSKDFKRLYERSPQSPASQHTWTEAINFCQTLEQKLDVLNIESKDKVPDRFEITLPTEQQWEYACRANTTTQWHFGDNPEDLVQFAWFGIRYPDFTVLPDVGLKQPNPWGLFDMYGMVYEWCLNDSYKYGLNSLLPVAFPSPTQKASIFKLARGGAIDDNAQNCRSASRLTLDHWNFYNDLTGFRIVINEA